jgi:hypothetical protein
VTVGPEEAGDDDELAEARVAAGHARELAAAAESAITPDVLAVVEANGGALTRQEFSIKPEESLTDKIFRKRKPSEDVASVAGRIEDVLRYTALLPDEGYWDTGSLICEALTNAGYEHVSQALGWQAAGYKGRNDSFRSPAGCLFELQMHTGASLHACEVTRDLYVEIRALDTPPEREWELRQQRDHVFAQVPIPPGTPIL